MERNRISKFDALWEKSRGLNPDSNETYPIEIPAGFVVQSLTHLPLGQQQLIAQQSDLYSWAYEVAKRNIDRDYFGDFVI